MENILKSEQVKKATHAVSAVPHGLLDYTMAGMLLSAPSIFKFERRARNTSYVLGSALLGTSLVTKYPLGAVKALPFPAHGALEFAVGLGMVACPWLMGFADDEVERNFFVANGLGLLGLVAVTDYHSADNMVSSETESAMFGEKKAAKDVPEEDFEDIYEIRTTYTEYIPPLT